MAMHFFCFFLFVLSMIDDDNHNEIEKFIMAHQKCTRIKTMPASEAQLKQWVYFHHPYQWSLSNIVV